MKGNWFGMTVGGCFIVVAGGVLAVGQPSGGTAPKPEATGEREAGEDVITLDSAPEPVRATALKLAGEAKNVTSVIREQNKAGATTFEVEYTDGVVKCAAILSPMGDVMETERAVPDSSLPGSVLAALRREFPGATFADAQAVTVHSYEINVVRDGKRHEVKVDATGGINDPSRATNDKKDRAKEKREKKDKKEGKRGKHDHEDESDDEG
jgi:hypothetical protein